MNNDRYEPSSALSLARAAREVVWWQSPEETLRDETLFLNHAMRWGTPEVVLTVRRHFDDERLRQALREALPGVFDRRSWAYWHIVLDMDPAPPMPVREIPGVDPAEMPLRVWPEDFRKARM